MESKGNLSSPVKISIIKSRLIKRTRSHSLHAARCRGNHLRSCRYCYRSIRRWCTALSCIVTATDFSEELISLVKKSGTPQGKPIIYCVMDATDETSLLSLGDQHFDHLVCTMAFMDIPDLNPFFREAQKLLKPNGSFMFATAYPAFFSNNPSFISKKNEVDGKTFIPML